MRLFDRTSEMPEDARQPPQDISSSSRELENEGFVRPYWTASVNLRNIRETKAEDGRGLLRQMPPRPMRNKYLFLARLKREIPGGQKSSRAPMIASATFAPRAGASSGFHRYTSCKFPAPVLRACSSAHRHPGAGGCRWLPPFVSHLYSPFRVRLHPVVPRNSAVHYKCGCPLRFPSCIIFQCARSNAPNP